MAGKYVAPAPELEAFTCPRCDTLTTQHFAEITVGSSYGGMRASRCSSCRKFCVWEVRRLPDASEVYVLVYPDESPAPPPNEDLPDDVKANYVEAADILNRSPKGAAALLRLAVQLLCKHLGKPGKNLNEDIGALVSEGLDWRVQRAMDIVRITGNEAVHPGEINLEDDRELALALFKFVNLIADQMITTPKEIEGFYELLPETKRQQVDQRDRQQKG